MQFANPQTIEFKGTTPGVGPGPKPPIAITINKGPLANILESIAEDQIVRESDCRALVPDETTPVSIAIEVGESNKIEFHGNCIAVVEALLALIPVLDYEEFPKYEKALIGFKQRLQNSVEEIDELWDSPILGFTISRRNQTGDWESRRPPVETAKDLRDYMRFPCGITEYALVHTGYNRQVLATWQHALTKVTNPLLRFAWCETQNQLAEQLERSDIPNRTIQNVVSLHIRQRLNIECKQRTR